MNNIYVDELPKKGSCIGGCPYAVTDTWVSYCPFQQDENGNHLIVEEDCIKTCPLKSLTDRLAEERKKVVQEIREKIRQDYPTIYFNLKEELFNSIDVLITMKKLTEILDQIERGE